MNLGKKIVVSLVAVLVLSVVGIVAPQAVKAEEATAEELTAQLQALMTELNSLKAQLASLEGTGTTTETTTETTTKETAATAYEGIPAGFTFENNLYSGLKNDDVKYLQIILEKEIGPPTYPEDVGATGYFGAVTKASVIKFQEKYADDILADYGLTEGTGYVGKSTLKKLNSLLAVTAAPETKPSEEKKAASEITSAVECVTAGYEWYDSACHAKEEVKKAASEITDAVECVTAGYEWYSDACHAKGEVKEEEKKEEAATGFSVALSADTPASTVIIAGSAATELAQFTFTNNGDSAVTVTGVKLKRTGVSSDTTLTSVYLFDGYSRLGDESTLSSGYANFNLSSGLFTVPAGESKTIAIRADVNSSAGGQTVGISIEAATDIASDADSVGGTFPLAGNTMSVASEPSNLGSASLGTVSPSTEATIDATDDFVAWQSILTVNNQDLKLEYLRLVQSGSISAGDLDNIRLKMSGTEIATGKLVPGTVGQDLVFDLSASPVTITRGQNPTLTVYVDIVNGANKSFRLGLEKASDIFLKDASYGCYVTISGTPKRAKLQTIKKGSVIVTKATDSPATSVVLNSTNVSLAKFNLKAYGEEVKVNSLGVQLATGNSTTAYLRNVSLFLDGVQVGNTANVAKATGGTTFNIYQKLPAGSSKVLEIKGDVYGCAASTCSGTNQLADGNTIQVKLLAGDTNAQGMDSLELLNVPASTVSGYSRSVGVGSLTLVTNGAYGNQIVSAGANTKIGSYTLQAGAADAINVSSFTVNVGVANGASLTNLSNLYVSYGGNKTSEKGSVSASNAFSGPYVLAAGKSIGIDVYATIDSGATGDFKTSLTVEGTRATDGVSVSKTAPASGYAQTISIATGQLAVAKSSDTPDSAIVVGSTDTYTSNVLLAKYTFSSLFEGFDITQVGITATTSDATATSPITTADNSDDFVSLYLKYTDADGTEITSDPVSLVNRTATFGNMTMNVPQNGSTKLSVYGIMNVVASSGYANTGDGPQVELTSYKYKSPSQAPTTSAATIFGNQMLLYKTQPTVGVRAGITSGTLVNGVNDIYPFTITAGATKDVGLKKLTFYVSAGMNATSDTIGTFKLYRGTTDITSKVSITEAGAGTDLTTGNLSNPTAATSVVVTFDSEEVISADTSQTYYLKASVSGVGTTGENIQTKLLGDAAYASPTTASAAASASSFVWTDRSAGFSHSESTSDWLNGYWVKTLPSETYTISK